MSYTVVIVESPAKCKKIEGYLGPNYKCIASFGHIQELNGIKSIEIENNFKPNFNLLESKIQQINKIKTLLKNSKEVLIASDDDREGDFHPSAWIRLKQYCKETGLYIKSMKIAFRSHEVDVGEEADGFYFCKGASAFMTSNITNELYIIGTLNDGVLRVEKWKVPELIKEGTELRNASIAGDCLISRHGKE